MQYSLNDVIAAPATPPGCSALAVIRISGKDAVETLCPFFTRPAALRKAKGYQALYGFIKDGRDRIDQVICLVFRAPHSFTGEDMVEISLHGNPELSRRVMQLLLTVCRPAQPGEFTFRAFMNHKLDLAQAEAVCDLINAQTQKAEASALNQLQGNLSKAISHYVSALTDCRITLELAIDFADQDLPLPDMAELNHRLQSLRQELALLHNTGSQGKVLREGYTILLAGAPNVGKSSIFNHFLQESRALVTPTPGTTRDYLEAWLNLNGYPIRLIDTAGLRNTEDQVERLGIDRTKELMQSADLVIYLADPGSIIHTEATVDLQRRNYLLALNKIDLLGFTSLPTSDSWLELITTRPFVPCSAKLDDGLSALKTAILARISYQELPQNGVLLTNARHLAAIERALSALDKGLQSLHDQKGWEFTAFDLIEAISALSEITGAITTDDMLERIFSHFCVGK